MDAIECDKCRQSTEHGHGFCFHYGRILSTKQRLADVTQHEIKISTTVRYRLEGSENVYLCDRCVVSSMLRQHVEDGVLHAVLGTLGTIGFIVVALEASWWWLLGILFCGFFFFAAQTCYRSYAKAKNALARNDPGELRILLPAPAELEVLGDQLAADLRKPVLMQSGIDLFMTRKGYGYVTTQENPDVLTFQASGPWRRRLAWISAAVALVLSGIGVGIGMAYLIDRGGVGPLLWFIAIIVPLFVAFLVFSAIRWVRL